MAEQIAQPKPVVSFMSEEQKQERQLLKKKIEKIRKKTEQIFKMLSVIVVLGTVMCFQNFFTFRNYCHSNNIYVISPVSFIWAAFGFAFHWFGRKWWTLFMQKRFQHYMHPRNAYYSQQNQQKKIKTITKQGFDLIFHTVTTIVILVLFRKEPWFPMCTGGLGSCDAIFATYPNWPQALNPAVQIFYQFQLGTNIYLLLDLLVFQKDFYQQNSFYQLMFHHFVATILILFSIGYNFVPIGTMVMFIHDSSDAFRALARVITESKYAIKRLALSKILDSIYFIVWGYMRILILPVCLIDSMYNHIVDVSEDFHFLYLQRYYLTTLCFGIYFLHSYWVFFLVRGNLQQWKQNEQFIKWQAQQLKKEISVEQKQIKQE